jgi:hypothetical protein
MARRRCRWYHGRKGVGDMRGPAISLMAFVLLAWASMAAHAAPQATGAPASAASANQPVVARDVKMAVNAYRSHRQAFSNVSDYSERVRGNWIAGLVAFLLFVLLTVPASFKSVGAFYRQMMETAPLSREEGMSEDNNRQARKLLFFYLLFLLYQLIEYPLTLGHAGRIQFVADLAIQIGLVIAIGWAYHGLRRGMHRQWKDDPARQEKTDHWLNARLDGMRIRWRDISGLAVVVFVVEFAPVFLSHLTDWLDALSAYGEKLAGS